MLSISLKQNQFWYLSILQLSNIIQSFGLCAAPYILLDSYVRHQHYKQMSQLPALTFTSPSFSPFVIKAGIQKYLLHQIKGFCCTPMTPKSHNVSFHLVLIIRVEHILLFIVALLVSCSKQQIMNVQMFPCTSRSKYYHGKSNHRGLCQRGILQNEK